MRPLSLHPDNPHYFLFRGAPTVLITSGEHYGAVMNAEFDYRTYLEVIAEAGFNLTRTFSGCYRELPGSFDIGEQNPLAPRPHHLLTPWARSDQPGYRGGGNRFDLDRWDEAYFARLRDFSAQASARGIVVEMVLFCVMYAGVCGEDLWEVSPLYHEGNVQGVGKLSAQYFNTLRDPELVARQEALVRKLSAELAEFDNVYYEICNEPYWGVADPGEIRAWEWHMTDVLVEAESALPAPHLIAHNIANGAAVVTEAHPAAAILNFNYAYPPTAVSSNYALDRALGDDETADGTNAPDRRREGWAFLLSGGSVYGNLDWSFARRDPRGEGRVEMLGRLRDGREVRRQLGLLRQFMDRLDFVRMRPAPDVALQLPEGVRAYALAEPGQQYAVYLEGGVVPALTLQVSPGRYQVEWYDPSSGPCGNAETEISGDPAQLTPPCPGPDLALILRAR